MNIDEEVKYKFKPVWLIILDLLIVYLIYCFVDGFISYSKIDAISFWMLSMLALTLWPIFKIVKISFRMLKGWPALVISKDGITDNLNDFSIKWRDVSEIYMTEEGRFAGSNLVVNLRAPDLYFCKTPIQKIFYKVRKYFTSADVAIKLSFINGKKEDVIDSINTYWPQSE
ncbi:STM3941 family protein [Mucilaginibacter calamicampi]|uniref:STM3941 family protein n=1 Tax=Mucilaginibacter calamicampi TaxID=1302352 RepID=A0ABW2YY38_9SPHI